MTDIAVDTVTVDIAEGPVVTVAVAEHAVQLLVDESGPTEITVTVMSESISVEQAAAPSFDVAEVAATIAVSSPIAVGAVAAESIRFVGEAAVDLSGHRAVTANPDGTLEYAQPATIVNRPVWITVGAADAGDSVEVVALGELTESSWNWTTDNVYLADDGVLTQTIPLSGALVVVAIASTPTTVFVDRQPTIDL